MLRIILWKIGFEWSHLKRILSPQSERKICYFAFGANLSPEVLQLRRMKVFDVFDFVLEGAVLNFSQSGFYKDHGYASADAAVGEVVYGKIYLILERDAERMDYFEGVPFLEVHEKVYRETQGRQFYYYRAIETIEGLSPTQEYLDYICTAYSEMECVPAAYLDKIKSTRVLERFEMMDETGFFVEDINRWPKFLHPLLVCYERFCHRLVQAIWNPSLVQWMIRL